MADGRAGPRDGSVVPAVSSGLSLDRGCYMRRVLAVLSVLLGTLTMGMVTAPASVAGATSPTTTIYDSTDPTSTSLVSQCYECAQVTQIGNQVSFGPGNRTLHSVTVQMESWACESGDAYGQTGPCISPDATFAQPMTLNLYNVGNDGVSVGTLIGSFPIVAQVKYRPTSDPVRCTTDSEWWDGTSCHHGIVSPVTFDVGDITVPNNVIYGVSVNTNDYGTPPTPCASQPAGCPADSLNFGLTTTSTPQVSVGSDPVLGAIYENTGYAPFYCDNGAAGTGTFRADLPLDYATNPTAPAQSCWSADGPYSSINGGNNSYGPAPYYVPAVSFTTEASCTTLCYVSPNGNDSNSGAADSPFATIQHAVNAVSSGGTVLVAPGTYNENVLISQPLTLAGANATHAATGPRGAESIISTNNASGNDFTVEVASPGVTVDGFTIQQTQQVTCAFCGAYGVQVDAAGTGATIADNVITGMSVSGTSPRTLNPIGVDVAGSGSTTPNNVTIARNLIENISSAGSQHTSALGIEVGAASVTGTGTGLVVANNHITGVSDAGWGGYGMIIDRATSGSHIVGNSIDTISGGGWGRGIGLEADEPGAVVLNNAISTVSSATAGAASDLWIDAADTSAASSTITDNALLGSTVGGLLNNQPATVTASSNFWGTPNGPNTAGASTTSGALTVTPWIGSYTSDPTKTGQPGFWPTAITSSAAPAFTSASSAAFETGAAGTFTVTASGSPAPTLSEANTDSLPPGVTFNPATGVLSGTPTALGTYTLHFTAHNGAGPDATQTFTLSVSGISSAASVQTSVGKHVNFTVTTSGHPTATIGETGMPAWMTLKPGTGSKAGTAKLSGVGPVGGGNFTFTLTATFGAGNVGTQSFTVHVLAISSAAAVSFSKSGPPTQSFTITTTGAGSAVAITAALGGLESGLTFHDNGNGTATISGTPAATDRTHLVKVTATSGAFSNKQKLAIGITP